MKQFSFFAVLLFSAISLFAQTRFFKHKVKQGETIASIAQKYEADKQYLLMLNDMPESRKLVAGDIILIRELKPGEEQIQETKQVIETSVYSPEVKAKPEAAKIEKSAVLAATAPKSSDPKAGADSKPGEAINYNGTVYVVSEDGYHTVEKGQTLYRLSVIYKTSVDKIKALNGLTSNDVPVGTKLKVK